MTQKLLLIQRDTKQELAEAIRRDMKKGEFRMVSLSVLEGLDHHEAWIIIEDHALAGFE